MLNPVLWLAHSNLTYDNVNYVNPNNFVNPSFRLENNLTYLNHVSKGYIWFHALTLWIVFNPMGWRLYHEDLLADIITLIVLISCTWVKHSCYVVLTSDVRWAVLMTKCDCAHEALKQDLGRIGNSRDILRIAQIAYDKLGVNMANILFIKVSSKHLVQKVYCILLYWLYCWIMTCEYCKITITYTSICNQSTIQFLHKLLLFLAFMVTLLHDPDR